MRWPLLASWMLAQMLFSGSEAKEIAEALVVMVSGDPNTVESAMADPSVFSFNVAAHLSLVANVPMGRLGVILQVPPKDAKVVSNSSEQLSCLPMTSIAATGGTGLLKPVVSTLVSLKEAGANATRFAGEANTTFLCKPVGRDINTTLAAPPAPAPGSAEDRSHIISSGPPVPANAAFLQERRRPTSVTWEVAIQGETGIQGDWTTSVEVAAAIVKISRGSAEPKVELLPDGNWSNSPGPDVLFMRFFPDTRAALPGEMLARQKETSLPLGANPGGLDAERGESTTSPAPSTTTLSEEAVAAFDSARRLLGSTKEEYLGPGTNNATVMAAELLKQANKVNFETRATIEEMSAGLARGSQAHLEYLTKDPYRPPRVWPSGPLLPDWP